MPLEDIIFYLAQIRVGSEFFQGQQALEEAVEILTQIENNPTLKSQWKSPK